MSKGLLCFLVALAMTLVAGCGEQGPLSWFKLSPPQIERPPESEEVSGTVLASIDGRKITLEEFSSRIEAVNNEIMASTEISASVKESYLIKDFVDKKNVLDKMVETELLIAEAIRRGLDKDKQLVEAVKALKEQLLLAKIVEAERAQAKITTKEVEEYYNMYKDAFAIPEERRVSMVVVPTESKAKEILISLLQGYEFSNLAKSNSSDESSASGGDIGFIVRKLPFPQPEKKTMFEKFETVAFALELNKPSAIFAGPNGFYIIKVSEIRPARERLLSEVYANIEQGLTLKKQEEALKSLIANLRRVGNIIVYDQLLRD